MKSLCLSGVLGVFLVFIAGTGLVIAQEAISPNADAPVYAIDGVHSTIGFSVKHLGIATTRGVFTDYEGEVSYDPENLESFKADVTIQVASINTNNQARDNHLRSGDFFAAEEFPVITFKSDRLEKRGDGLVLVGDLTIRGVTRQITMPVTMAGPVQGMGGKTVAALEARTTINRLDYGVAWSQTMDNGGLIVDSAVNIEVELELHQK